MDPPPADPYTSIVDLYRRLDALVPVCAMCNPRCFLLLTPHEANIATPLTGPEDECLALLMSARSTRDTYLSQCESSRQDVAAAHERLKLFEARAQHYATTTSAVEDFIGEARSRFRARKIPIHPISIPPSANSTVPSDPASQLHATDESATIRSDHIQESAGRMAAVTGATSEGVRVPLNYICVYFLRVATSRIRNDCSMSLCVSTRCNVRRVLTNINMLVQQSTPLCSPFSLSNHLLSPDSYGIQQPNPPSFIYLLFLIMQTPSTLRRSTRRTPAEVLSPLTQPQNTRKRPQDDTSELNPMAPKRGRPSRKVLCLHLFEWPCKAHGEISAGIKGSTKGEVQQPTTATC